MIFVKQSLNVAMAALTKPSNLANLVPDCMRYKHAQNGITRYFLTSSSVQTTNVSGFYMVGSQIDAQQMRLYSYFIRISTSMKRSIGASTYMCFSMK